jgi:hypothetical protein
VRRGSGRGGGGGANLCERDAGACAVSPLPLVVDYVLSHRTCRALHICLSAAYYIEPTGVLVSRDVYLNLCG